MYYRIYTNQNRLSISQYSYTKFFLHKDIANKYKELCLKSKNNKIKDNSIIYPSPLSNYPGYKLDNYISENKLSIKKSYTPSKVDTIILDEDAVDNLRIYDYSSERIIIPVSEFKKYYTSLIPLSDSHSHTFLSSLTDSDSLYINKNDININFEKTFNDYPILVGGEIYVNQKNNKTIEFLSTLFDYIEKYNWHVVLDGSINSESNKDLVLDQESFENLYSMLASNNQGNLKLAREIIANCHYEYSKPYVLFLSSVFIKLLNKSDNRNYHLIYELLFKDLKKMGLNKRNIEDSHYNTIKNILKAHPEYRLDITKCLKIHNNHCYGSDLIKEIIPN